MKNIAKYVIEKMKKDKKSSRCSSQDEETEHIDESNGGSDEDYEDSDEKPKSKEKVIYEVR